MADIVKAIEKEREYLSYRMKGEEPYHLVDAIKELGFESLDEYFNAKRDYEFSQIQFEVVETSPSDCISEGLRLLDNEITGAVIVECDHTFVFSGDTKPFDEEYCNTNDIPIYPLYTRGGTMVNSTGDFAFGVCVPASVVSKPQYFLRKIAALLSELMPNIAVEDNDIMLNGCKVCGTTGYTRNGMYLFIADFSFSDKSELIEKICSVSNSIKPVSYINGTSASVFKGELKKWLKIL